MLASEARPHFWVVRKINNNASTWQTADSLTVRIIFFLILFDIPLVQRYCCVCKNHGQKYIGDKEFQCIDLQQIKGSDECEYNVAEMHILTLCSKTTVKQDVVQCISTVVLNQTIICQQLFRLKVVNRRFIRSR